MPANPGLSALPAGQSTVGVPLSNSVSQEQERAADNSDASKDGSGEQSALAPLLMGGSVLD